MLFTRGWGAARMRHNPGWDNYGVGPETDPQTISQGCLSVGLQKRGNAPECSCIYFYLSGLVA